MGRMTRGWVICTCALQALLLAACGGGGGDAGNPGNPQNPQGSTYDVAALWSAYAAGDRVTVLTGVGFNIVTLVSDDVFEYTYRYQARQQTTFPLTGVAAWLMTRTGSYAARSLPGVSTPLMTEDLFVDDASRLLGYRFSASGSAPSCERATVLSTLPTAATLPASGVLATTEYHFPCAPPLASSQPSLQSRWRLTQEEGGTFFCLSLEGLASGTTGGEFCYEVASRNTLGSRARFTFVPVGTSMPMVLRNYTP